MARRGWWGAVIAVGALGMIAAFVVIAQYPLPNVPGGWCQTGFSPHHHTVQTVTRIALYLDIAFAVAIVVAAGALTGQLGRGILISTLSAVPVGVLFLMTAATYIGRINCAFYG